MDWGMRRLAGLWGALLVGVAGCDDPTAPIVSATELHIRHIYDAGEFADA